MTVKRPAVLALFLFLAALLSPAFSACLSDSDCPAGESCAATLSRCYLADFAYTQPPLMKVALGERKTFNVLLSSPLPENREISLSLAGDGRYFAKFVGGTPTLSVIVSPNETMRIPIIFLGGAVGPKSVCVNAEDTRLPEINNTHPTSKACTSFIIESGERGIFTISTPSMDLWGIVLVGLAGSLSYSFLERKRK